MRYLIRLTDTAVGAVKMEVEIESTEDDVRKLVDLMNYAHWPKNFSVELIFIDDQKPVFVGGGDAAPGA